MEGSQRPSGEKLGKVVEKHVNGIVVVFLLIQVKLTKRHFDRRVAAL